MENKSFSISDEVSSGKENGIAHKENGRTTYPSTLTPVNGKGLPQNRLEFRENNNEPKEEDDTDYMCGAFSKYPKWMQRFASPRWFLAAYCIQNIIAGAEGSFIIGCTSSIEKHFQFSSGDMGLIILLSEIGPIITTVLLSYLGGKGNRPRWLGIGAAIGGLGVLLIFLTFLIYPAPTLSESGLLDNSKKFCDVQDIINFQFLNATTTSSLDLASYTVESQPSCQSSNNLAFFLWLMGFMFKALSGTILYIVGAPYIDDSVSKKSAPIYFAISTSVRILGPTIGFSLSALALNTYVYPGENFGITPHDPRWIGAWWTGPLVFSSLMLAYAFTLSFFPRKLRRPEPAKDSEVCAAKENGVASRQLSGEDLVKTSVIPTSEVYPPYKINIGSNGHMTRGHHNGHIVSRWAAIDNDFDRQLEADDGYSNTDGFSDQGAIQDKAVFEGKKNALKNFMPENHKNTGKEFLNALKRLSKNPVLVFLSLSDFLVLIAELGLIMWLAKYQEHQFRITKSSSAFFSGISSTSSLLLGVFGGGLWIRRFRPKGKTVAYLMTFCSLVYMLTLIGVMFISCDFQQDLPGILSPDAKSVELYRGCSSGCDCDLKEFIPVCVRDGPITLTYFSPCHAGCPETSPPPPGTNSLMAEAEGAADEAHREVFYNCTCGSPSATVTSGYCQDSCSGFIVYNIVMVVVRSFISVGIIGGTLMGMRCVAVEDKPLAIGFKTSMVSAALIVNPLIYGSLIDSSCLVWEETCQNGSGSCWLYNTDDFRYKLHGVPAFCLLLCSICTFIVAHKIGDLQLVDESPPSTQSSPTSSFLFSSGPAAGRKSSLRRSLKKISRLVGRENGGSRSPGRKKEEKEDQVSPGGTEDKDKQKKMERDAGKSETEGSQQPYPQLAGGNMLPSRIVKTTGV
ncbi:solute carrier organic anion transporter family member 74D-like [Palaemon carinicauda]|uniref:solute carrier organic anion transporter family member 74D-like n=1 Tax=Palaemon carinicauda TaxID=392227 RepID=UPI0035B623E0